MASPKREICNKNSHYSDQIESVEIKTVFYYKQWKKNSEIENCFLIAY